MTRKQPLGAMHIIDTLAAAGAERVAVNIVNHLPRDRYVPYLCTTRSDGPLDAQVASDVVRVRLGRKSRFDSGAVRRLRDFLRENDIRILHAHSSSLFIARLAAWGTQTAIIWHAHHGRYALDNQRAYHYRIGTSGIGGIITVNQDLAEWCSRRLGMPRESIWYLPNPVALDKGNFPSPLVLPGVNGKRILCVANFRPEKDHLTLVQAMAGVIRDVPDAHLFLVGKINDPMYKARVATEISTLRLKHHISILGERHDIPAILQACDIGVLSSVSEGLPMSLLEYGAAGLPAIATETGQCSDVLDHGHAGILVPPSSADHLAKAMILLLQAPQKRRLLAERLRARVDKTYRADAVSRQICDIYDTVLRQHEHPTNVSNIPIHHIETPYAAITADRISE